MWVLPVLLVLAWCAVALTALREIRVTPRLLGVVPPGAKRPRVLAVVPARDEEDGVERCLASLVAQEGVDLTAVLYDDGSTDRTHALAQGVATRSGGRLTVVKGTAEPPPGWCGKPHAIHQAFLAAGYDVEAARFQDGTTPDLLLLLDADVVLHPAAVAELAHRTLEAGAGIGSALPHLTCLGFWEHVVAVNVGALITSRHRPSRVNDSSRPDALANGQFMVVTPEAYGQVQGHAGVRAEVLEDVALAARIKGRGHPVFLADGRRVLSTRMYGSLAEMWAGWMKNAFLLAGGTVGRVAGYAVGLLAMSWLPVACAVTAITLGPVVEAVPWAAGYLVPLTWQVTLRRMGGQEGRFALFAPLGTAVVALLLASSTWRALRRSPVAWKGRPLVDGEGVAPLKGPGAGA
jgi:GT2 family glycosyltransferase